MAYADYTYYTTTFGGSVIPQTEFTRLANESSAFIDYVTFGESKNVNPVTDALKNACCAVAEVSYKYSNGMAGITSESVGRVSRTYASGSESKSKSKYNAAALYLAGTGLLNQGVGHDFKL